MLQPYRNVLSHPGALQFSLSGLLARMPTGMYSLGIALMIQGLYNSYALAGAVSAVYVVAQAIASPQIARYVDMRGQARIMGPVITINILCWIAFISVAVARLPQWSLFICAACIGGSMGSIGAMVRARWTYVLRDDPRQLDTAFALEATLDEVVFIVGPILATILSTTVLPVVHDIWPPAGLVVAVIFAAVGGFLFLRLRSTEPPLTSPHDRHKGTVLKSFGVVIVSIVFLALGSIFGATDITVVAFAKEHGQPSMSGVLLAVFALGSLIAGFAYGLRHWVWPAWLRFTITAVTLGVGVCSFFFVTSITGLMVVMLIVGLTIAPTLVMGNAIIKDFAPTGRLTEALTWANTATLFGVAFGSTAAGWMIERIGAHGGFGIVVGCGITCAVLVLCTMPFMKRRYRSL